MRRLSWEACGFCEGGGDSEFMSTVSTALLGNANEIHFPNAIRYAIHLKYTSAFQITFGIAFLRPKIK